MSTGFVKQYKKIYEADFVLIKIPAHLEYIAPHIYRCGEVDVPMNEHYKSKCYVAGTGQKPIIVNQKFFGIDGRDAGRLIVATVVVEEVVVKDDRKFIQLIIERSASARAKQKMLIMKHAPGGIHIPNTDFVIKFEATND